MGDLRQSIMEPVRDSRATLVDLLDRVLDKGLVLYADVIVSVAGVPLIGINLRAALAGMETMLQYGMMQDWDESVRAWEREKRGERAVTVASGNGDGLVEAGVFCPRARQ